ncbi:ABC transporter permease [Phytohabitans flavus]|uniref:ABC transporter permease n=1 Tax=Phytohabitans flavus TaxID=1076124 RepID=A0A6F8XX24_9ACTN|nr:ABC transporter permease [Phytohabitans flavus]BCB78347.1 ABC transporter permease [Phytohabitans flavus]
MVSAPTRRPRNLAGWVGKLIVAALVVAVWEASVRLWLPDYLPTPSGVVRAAWPTLISADFGKAFGDTISGVAAGLLIGCLAGTALGLATGRLPWLRYLTSPYLSGLYAMPMLAIVPMATIWLGYSSQTRLAVIALSAFLPCAVSTGDGARNVPSQLRETAKVLRLSRVRFVLDVLLPSTLPFVVAGVQVAVGRALVGAVAVEFLASLPGLGTFILTNARSFEQNTAFVAVFVLAVLGIAARAGTETALHRLMPWHLHVNR